MSEMETEFSVGEYCSNHNNLGVEPNDPLAYDPGLELNRPTMIILGGYGGQ